MKSSFVGPTRRVKVAISKEHAGTLNDLVHLLETPTDAVIVSAIAMLVRERADGHVRDSPSEAGAPTAVIDVMLPVLFVHQLASFGGSYRRTLERALDALLDALYSGIRLSPDDLRRMGLPSGGANGPS